MSDPSLRVNGLLTRPLVCFDSSLSTIAFPEACKRDSISPSIASPTLTVSLALWWKANSITWVHVAIDRFTGQVIDKQIEVVNE
jgi:hypothetical protein